MYFENAGLVVNHPLLQHATNTLYQPITTETIIYAAQVGLVAGIIMALVGMLLGFLKLGSLDLTTYTGCIITNQAQGITPLVAGTLLHLVASAALAVAYLYILHTFNIPATIVHAFVFGIAHSFISGCLMIALDAFNPCVANKTMRRMGFAASAQGKNATLIFTIIHIVYAVVVVMMLVQK